MTEYLVRNICTECGNPVEITVRNGYHANLLKGGPCICNKCVPDSKWQSLIELCTPNLETYLDNEVLSFQNSESPANSGQEAPK